MTFFRRLKWWIKRRAKDTELREELEFHLDQEAEQRQADGLPGEEARQAARRDLGNLTRVQEETRAMWGWTFFEQFAQDLRYAARTMATNRLFTLLAVTSLALGIGANTAIFSFMDAILLRSLPVADPDSLVLLNWRAKVETHWFNSVVKSISGTTYEDGKSGTAAGIFPFPALELFRKDEAVFSNVFAYFRSWQARNLNLTIKGQSGVASSEFVSGNFFGVLGVAPAAGRLLVDDDDRPGAPAAAVVSYAFSQRRFGGPANAARQSILIDRVPFTVVGVAPPEFFGVDPAAAPDVFLPMHTNELLGAGQPFGFQPQDYLESHYYWVQVMARLRPGVSLAEAQAAAAPVFHRWVASTAANDAERANLPQLWIRPGAGGLDSLRRRYSRPLVVLMAMVGLILALACANVANLLLARAAARTREIALRLSVGASRGRVVRQLLTESVLLASLGGLLGILFGIWGIRVLTTLLANGEANFSLHAQLNWHVLGAAAGLSLITGMIFGLAPALQATRVDVMPALKETPAGKPRRFSRISLSGALVMSQIAISLVMLVAAGLFVRTLSNLHSVELGFNRENVLLFRLDARKAGHKDPEIDSFYGALRQRFSAIPGVRNVSLSEDSLIEAGTGLPLSVGNEAANDDNRLLTIGPAFFSTMQIPILTGRGIEELDGPGSQAVAVINQEFVKANLGNRNPLGRHLILRGGGDQIVRDMVIVGVCGNARYGGLTRRIPPVAYIPYNQGYPWPDRMVYALRTTGDPLGYVNSVREIVRQADARVPVYDIRTQIADIDKTINQEITFADLCSGFAILALLIACVGLYGTVSYNVARRSGEIGIRMALGAQRARVVRMVLSGVLRLAGAGLAIGLAIALTTSRFVASFLYGMKANDPWSLTLAVVILVIAALTAGYVPARRASRIDPMSAIRHE